MLWLFALSCLSEPCDKPLTSNSSLIDVFIRMEKERCVHAVDISTMRRRMSEYHRQTTLHCDNVFRRTSMDGKNFDGQEELILKGASVADVWIEPDGKHIIVYNDTKTDLLAQTAEIDLEQFWKMGLVGFGGLGIAIDKMNGGPVESFQTDLHLPAPMEVVDPDIGRTIDGDWRLVWFGVTPTQMNKESFGPLTSPKPHRFYRAVSPNLTEFNPPKVIVQSKEGTTGGADPAMLTREDGSEVLYVGPLDFTTMAWESVDGENWNALGAPDFNTRLRFATPDAVIDPEGGYRLYGMLNGTPGEFQMAQSQDGERFTKPKTVLKVTGGFNISVGVDPVGTWWVYYNKTDEACMRRWGSSKAHPEMKPMLR